jgi:hypothetical protein
MSYITEGKPMQINLTLTCEETIESGWLKYLCT